VLFFPWEQSAEVLHAWRESLPGYPDELTSTARMIQFPPLPELPEAMRGNSFVIVDAAYLGTEADGAELLRPLRELGPVIDTFEMVEPAALAGLHMDPPDPLPYVSHSRLLGDLPAKAIDDLVRVAGPGSDSPLAIVELRHTGGALARSAPHHGALATLGGSFMTFAAGVAFDEASAEANRAHARAVAEAVRPYDAGISYANFVEEQVEADRFFPDSTLRRLQAVKAQVDPGDLFQANHPIPPAR
jgi:hypothetical protein